MNCILIKLGGGGEEKGRKGENTSRDSAVEVQRRYKEQKPVLDGFKEHETV